MAGSKTFSDYFKESMDSMGLPTPPTAFTSLTTATATVNTIVGAAVKLGTTATLGELWISVGVVGAGGAGAATALVELGVAAAGVTAAFYAGACVGALLFATQMSLGLDPFASNAPAEIGKTLSRAKQFGISIPHNGQTMLAHAARSHAVHGPNVARGTI
jgi:hypothetical protein